MSTSAPGPPSGLKEGGLYIEGMDWPRSTCARYFVVRRRAGRLQTVEFALSLDNLRPLAVAMVFALHDDDPETRALSRVVGLLRADEAFRAPFDAAIDRLLERERLFRAAGRRLRQRSAGGAGAGRAGGGLRERSSGPSSPKASWRPPSRPSGAPGFARGATRWGTWPWIPRPSRRSLEGRGRPGRCFPVLRLRGEDVGPRRERRRGGLRHDDPALGPGRLLRGGVPGRHGVGGGGERAGRRARPKDPHRGEGRRLHPRPRGGERGRHEGPGLRRARA